MARKIDPAVETILTTLGLKSTEVLWDCHGTWVMYHRALEKVAANLNITFSPPAILEANGVAKSVAICVTGRTPAGKEEWSIGEASPANNKNAYPWAMAEKRAKDRVILKIIGLHGMIYSEDEMDRTAPTQATPEPENAPKIDPAESKELASEMIAELKALKDAAVLQRWFDARTNAGSFDSLAESDKSRVRETYRQTRNNLNPPADLRKAG